MFRNNIRATSSLLLFRLPTLSPQAATLPSKNNNTKRTASRPGTGRSGRGRNTPGRGSVRAGRGGMPAAAATSLAQPLQQHSGRRVAPVQHGAPIRVAARGGGRGAAQQTGTRTQAAPSAVNLRIARMLTEGRNYNGATPKTILELMHPVSRGIVSSSREYDHTAMRQFASQNSLHAIDVLTENDAKAAECSST